MNPRSCLSRNLHKEPQFACHSLFVKWLNSNVARFRIQGLEHNVHFTGAPPRWLGRVTSTTQAGCAYKRFNIRITYRPPASCGASLGTTVVSKRALDERLLRS
jgi:hypothetical protein